MMSSSFKKNKPKIMMMMYIGRRRRCFEAQSNRRFSEERGELRHTSGSERLGRGECRFNDALGEGFASGVPKGL